MTGANKIFALLHCIFISSIIGFSIGGVTYSNSDPSTHQCLVVKSVVTESNLFFTNLRTYVPTWEISFRDDSNLSESSRKTIRGSDYLLNISATKELDKYSYDGNYTCYKNHRSVQWRKKYTMPIWIIIVIAVCIFIEIILIILLLVKLVFYTSVLLNKAKNDVILQLDDIRSEYEELV